MIIIIIGMSVIVIPLWMPAKRRVPRVRRKARPRSSYSGVSPRTDHARFLLVSYNSFMVNN